MGWFQRYGVPGGLFLVLAMAWASVLYDFARAAPGLPDKTLIAAAAAISFVPIGFVLSTLGLFVYLKCGGVHQEALKKLKGQAGWEAQLLSLFPEQCRAEPKLEVLSTLLVVDGILSLEMERFARDWVSRRMDVIAICRSVMIATLVAPVAGFVLPFIFLRQPWPMWAWGNWTFWSLAALSLVLSVYMFWGEQLLRDQVSDLIAGIFKRRADAKERKAPVESCC
jgi:hypothetical protein